MKDTTLKYTVSYVSWILGQTAAILGAILVLIWGFDLVILQAQHVYAQGLGEAAMTADAWRPPFGPPLVGLGLALAGWMASHARGLYPPAPVIVGAALNLLALVMAMVAEAL